MSGKLGALAFFRSSRYWEQVPKSSADRLPGRLSNRPASTHWESGRSYALETRPRSAGPLSFSGRRSQVARLDLLQLPVRFHRQLDRDRVAPPHLAACHHDPHHAGLAHQLAVPVAVEHGARQPLLEAVELLAGVAQAGDLDDGVGAESQPRPSR